MPEFFSSIKPLTVTVESTICNIKCSDKNWPRLVASDGRTYGRTYGKQFLSSRLNWSWEYHEIYIYNLPNLRLSFNGSIYICSGNSTFDNRCNKLEDWLNVKHTSYAVLRLPACIIIILSGWLHWKEFVSSPVECIGKNSSALRFIALERIRPTRHTFQLFCCFPIWKYFNSQSYCDL